MTLPQTYYLIRAQKDGQYLTARSTVDVDLDRPAGSPAKYLLLFTQDYDALSYLQTHAAEYRDRFAVEVVLSSQVKPLIQRWGFQGTALVTDPLLPRLEFLTVS